MSLSEELAPYQRWLPELDGGQMVRLEAHLDLLFVWNRKINLTAIRDRREAVERHIAESLFLASFIPDEPLTVCDLGSGGGFPGIPVAIARPAAQVTLVESDQRKSVFLREASRRLSNVRVVARRFEEILEPFDVLVTRAVNLSGIHTSPAVKTVLLLTNSEAGPNAGFYQNWNWESTQIPWSKGLSVLRGTPVNIG